MTRFQKTSLYGVIAAIFCVSLVSPAVSQIAEGKTAFDNLKLAGQRKPGTLVGNGLNRVQGKINLPFGDGGNVTATEAPQSRTEALFSTFFDNILTVIADGISSFFTNLISSLFAGNVTFPTATVPGNLATPGSGTTTTPGNTTGSGATTTPGLGTTTTPGNTTTPGSSTTPGTSTTPGNSTTPGGSRDTGGGRGGRG